jgi:mannose-6-phosphate isomerase-like protein (cupin superfamily)
MVTYVHKPWGSETIWAHTEYYVGKILQVNAGHKLSVQYHKEKDETMYVFSGKGYIKFYEFDDIEEFVPTKIYEVVAGDSIHIPPRQIHNLEAITDMLVLEASTNHLSDLIRLRDNYHRK